MRRAAEDLAERLSAVERRFGQAATLFCLTADAREAILAKRQGARRHARRGRRGLSAAGAGDMAAPETVPFAPESLDLAVSLLSLHEANDIPGMLIQIRRALTPGRAVPRRHGRRRHAGRVARKPACRRKRSSRRRRPARHSVRRCPRRRRPAAAAGFALPVADVETVTVRYADMFALMRDLRAMGADQRAGRALAPAGAARAVPARARNSMPSAFPIRTGGSGRRSRSSGCPAGRRHPTQQKPLKPGSGKVSLADALRIGEDKTDTE